MKKLAVVVLTLWCTPAFPWTLEGHRLVARIAETMLTPPARGWVAAILHPDESLASVAGWADDVRPSRKETEPWHFVDIPITQSGLDMARDCPQGNCVIGKINEFRKALKRGSGTAEYRHEALLFLVHFVGDMHQPLHCATNNDKGGNELQVRFLGQAMNLHRVWDRAFFEQMPAENDLFTAFSRAIGTEQIDLWSKGTVEEWAQESFELARGTVYGNLPKVLPGEPPAIGEMYITQAEPVVEVQIEKAGVRLAAILNGIANSIE